MTAVNEAPNRGQERRLIFENVANGVPIEQIMTAFRRSEAEVWREVEFVGKKIREARFKCQLPPIDHQGIAAIRRNRLPLLEALAQMRDQYLSSDLILPKIGVQALDSPGIIREAAQHVKARVTGI